jgi:exopolyphosphatase/guanosine-5'-triphosphate,3'-diphosphate pyrophosphatase
MRDYVAIFDIGSNAVRLVVYDGLSRAPVKIHNERNVCGLGADLATTGRLNPDGVKAALGSLGRFASLVSAMNIHHTFAVATAAVRDASDGPAFIARVKRDFGLEISIIEGEEEARLSAQGVLSNGLGDGGLIGDYGGGSLELIAAEGRKINHAVSLPLGSLRLLPLSTRSARVKAIDAALDAAPFLSAYKGRDFVALGGAWRSMAKAHMHLKKHPLPVLDHYAIEGKHALEFAALIARQSPASLEKSVGFSRRRVRDVGVSALVMERLFERVRPARLVFSASGLREGLLFDRLSPKEQKQDALLAGCEKFALRLSRFGDLKGFRALQDFAAPLFADEKTARLSRASCVLSDLAGFDHEDFQAEQAFRRILVLPFSAADHEARAFLALSQYARYKGYIRRTRTDVTLPAQKLLDEKTLNAALACGLAQRLGYLLTGGALELLKHAELKITEKRLALKLSPGADALNAAAVEGALKDLASALGKEAA